MRNMQRQSDAQFEVKSKNMKFLKNCKLYSSYILITVYMYLLLKSNITACVSRLVKLVME